MIQTYFEPADDKQSLNVKLLDARCNLALLVSGQSALSSEESTSLRHPARDI